GAGGAMLLAFGTSNRWPIAALAGFVLFGVAAATAQLTRAAAGDLFAPAHRARGISFIMFGAVFGAILGPTVFAPMFRGRDLSTDSLLIPWLGAAVLLSISALIVLMVRPDPKVIAESIEKSLGITKPDTSAAAPLGEIIKRPGV